MGNGEWSIGIEKLELEVWGFKFEYRNGEELMEWNMGTGIEMRSGTGRLNERNGFGMGTGNETRRQRTGMGLDNKPKRLHYLLVASSKAT